MNTEYSHEFTSVFLKPQCFIPSSSLSKTARTSTSFPNAAALAMTRRTALIKRSFCLRWFSYQIFNIR